MLDVSIQQRVLDLQRESTLSVRDIAKRLGVSRGFVSTIVRRGTVRDHKRNGGLPNSRRVRMWGGTPRKTLKYKCEGCGYLVNLKPCMICRVKEARGE